MIYMLLPAYNEERDLPTLLERVQAMLKYSALQIHVLLVNAGSRTGHWKSRTNLRNGWRSLITALTKGWARSIAPGDTGPIRRSQRRHE